MCIGIRPKDSNAFYDIGYFSLINWESEPLQWKSKDGFFNDITSYCGYGFDFKGSPNYLPEEDNNWEVLKSSYNSDSSEVTFSFKRNIVGSSKKDYTFKILEENEFRWVIGDWANENQHSTSVGKESAARDSNGEYNTLIF